MVARGAKFSMHYNNLRLQVALLRVMSKSLQPARIMNRVIKIPNQEQYAVLLAVAQ